ncbi:glycoside hydrolase family 18 protein [Aliarcobacter butzleri]|jgi:hypothetical protein|uniref:Rhodanese domain-containing protein n=3 Tax=Aliarcobacter butzleri TaxID=28197 RepID=A0AAP4P7F6_9BACT|nr:hypothetical protein [Aliarcobacter butzleri]AGR77645.1 hypothetical protein A7H1H_1356 [Aliarcobacter butzleri 7h1h]EFU69073.1 conserved hypothetical protein [Aliarcobacter butzleri JV22]KLD98081.1 hypothetical protein AF74_03820 [Aliarcobacter butzleri L349]KLE00877.1 hypothetical protein AF76_06320 [Aliarcobacter butzleri L351]KLE08536.1 hypothetical protein AF80_09575 [Aliarcobacter butzleri L355]
MFLKDEWTQEELFRNKKILEKEGVKVVVIDTILKPLETIETITYNPYEMNNYPKNTVFVFYCDTGKTTKERIGYYKKKFPNYKCVSLKGGRAYFRPNFQLSDDE